MENTCGICVLPAFINPLLGRDVRVELLWLSNHFLASIDLNGLWTAISRGWRVSVQPGNWQSLVSGNWNKKNIGFIVRNPVKHQLGRHPCLVQSSHQATIPRCDSFVINIGGSFWPFEEHPRTTVTRFFSSPTTPAYFTRSFFWLNHLQIILLFIANLDPVSLRFQNKTTLAFA